MSQRRTVGAHDQMVVEDTVRALSARETRCYTSREEAVTGKVCPMLS